MLGQPLGVLGLSYPSWDKCWFSLPAGVPGELLGQVGGQRYHTIINTSTSLNFLFQAAPSHTDKGGQGGDGERIVGHPGVLENSLTELVENYFQLLCKFTLSSVILCYIIKP